MSRLIRCAGWLLFGLVFVAALPLRCAAQNRLTVLNDAFGKQASLEQDWGYAALIEFEGKRILFDTGDNAALFQRNVERMHVDLSKLDMVVISHAHGDHTSGLRYVLSRNPSVPIYVPDDPFFTGSTLPEGFLTTDARPDLPSEMRYFNGKGRPQPKGWEAWSDTRMMVVRGPVSVSPHVHLVALVSEKPAFKGLHEISLVLDTPKGPVVVAGCSHPGIEAILAQATSADPAKPVYMLFGGLHLLQDSAAQIDGTLGTLADTYHVQTMAVGHCTGELAFAKIQRKWGKQDVYAGLGETIPF